MSITSATWNSTVSGLKRPKKFLSGAILDLDYRVTEHGEERWTAVGQTSAGRVLVIVWTMLEDELYRPITAYPATKGLEAVYWRVAQGTAT